MRKGLLSICFMVFLTSFGFGFLSDSLKGRVYDSDGNPLHNVKVEVVDTTISTYTDSEGIFELEGLEQDPLRLRFSHPDYTTQSTEVPLKEAAGQFVQIFLTSKNPIVMTLKEEIAVTAEADSIIDVSLPSHRTILPSSVLTEMGTANIAESVDKVPGVASVGKGGYSMAPAIRGLAEHRVLLLVDGVRITSERRIGASASFINLGDIDRVEINRGPYSVFYGSGAVGGIINIITKSPAPYSPLKGDFYLSYNSNRTERAGAAALSGSLGKWGIMFGANAKKADDYSSPSGPVTWSRYSDYNFMLKIDRRDELSRFYATLYRYQGDDIGKPSPTSQFKPRWYPNERNTLITLGYERRQIFFMDSINLSLYALNNLLETQADNLRNDLTLSKRNLAEIKGTNVGLRFRGSKGIARSHTLNLGIDYFGQMNVNDRNTEWRYSSDGTVISKSDEVSLHDARRGNFGLYLDDKIQLAESLSMNLGSRFDFVQTSNLDLQDKRLSRHDEFLSLYLGTVYQATSHLSFLANVGRSFRFPTISELFYTGLTGRGTVFGNPDLEPEASLNFDIGIRYLHERFYASLFGFSNGIDKMIQKYSGTDLEEYFYRNLSAGRITGVEGELYVHIVKDVEFFFNFHHMQGRDRDTDMNLNYIPPTRLTFWGKYSPGNFWVEPRFTFAASKSDPGPLEIKTDAYVLFDAILGYELSDNLTCLVIAQNILDQTYRASADEQGVDAPGRGLVLRAKFAF